MVTGYDTDWGSFIRRIEMKMTNNGIEIPDNLSLLVEDQICQSMPASKCYKAGAGDVVAGVIQSVARVADRVAHRVGIKTTLVQKAKGCAGCNKRRQKMNGI